MALQMYSAAVYIFTSVWGYTIMKDSEFLPIWFGGKGQISKAFEDFPF